MVDFKTDLMDAQLIGTESIANACTTQFNNSFGID